MIGKAIAVRPTGLLCVGLLVLIGWTATTNAADKLRIGVTLHPYYSWLTSLVGDRVEVVPILAEDSDPHVYQPLPEDIEKLKTLDALVINGVGHDEFIDPMLRAVGDRTPELLRPNAGLAMLTGAEASGEDRSMNSHTFLSITGAAHQIGNLAAELQRLDPAHAEQYRRNARRYKRRLRQLQADALADLRGLRLEHLRIGTVHDGYRYLFQELGLDIDAVVQPRHGINPSARQLADSIRRIRAAGINVLFAEMDYDQQFVDLILEETGTRIARLSHISRGPYTPDGYERQMAENLRRILDAVRAVQ